MYYSSTPKKYSRKGLICTCECFITDENSKTIDTGLIRYKVKPCRSSSFFSNTKKNRWGSSPNWGEFEDIVELPELIKKMNKIPLIQDGYFKRDGVHMPFIHSLILNNDMVNEYLIIKKQVERNKKLKSLNE